MRAPRLPLNSAALALILLVGMVVPARTSSAEPAVAGQDRPQTLTATIGELRTRIEGAKQWTLSGIEHKGTVMAVEDSAYGVVLTIRGVGHLGTAHFLEVPGKPGELEKEDVTDLRFAVDGRPVTRFAAQMDVTGDSFRMERKSTIRELSLHSTVEIRDNVLIETARLKGAQSMDLNTAHLLMYAWTPKATHYLYGDSAKVVKRGEFLPGNAEVTREVEPSADWVAVFDAASGNGAVCYVLERPAEPASRFLCVDAPGVYRKTALQTFVETPMPAGFEGTYRSAVGFFEATPSNWQQRAMERAAALKQIGSTLEKR